MTTDQIVALMKALLAEIRQHTAAQEDDAADDAIKRLVPLIEEFQAQTSAKY